MSDQATAVPETPSNSSPCSDAGGFVERLVKCPTCGGDAQPMENHVEAVPANGAEVLHHLEKVRKAVRKYYLALDRREHGGIAKDKAMRQIQEVLGMNWQQGEATQWLESRPLLKPLYE